MTIPPPPPDRDAFTEVMAVPVRHQQRREQQPVGTAITVVLVTAGLGTLAVLAYLGWFVLASGDAEDKPSVAAPTGSPGASDFIAGTGPATPPPPAGAAPGAGSLARDVPGDSGPVQAPRGNGKPREEPAEDRVVMPDVVGKAEDAAHAILADLGFEVRVVTEESSFSPPGVVVEQEFRRGSRRYPGETVTIRVAVDPGQKEDPDGAEDPLPTPSDAPGG